MSDERSLLENVCRTFYVEGYRQGSMHPRGEDVRAKAEELAGLFWRVVEDRNRSLRVLAGRVRSVSPGERDE